MLTGGQSAGSGGGEDQCFFPPSKKNSRKFLSTIPFDLSWTYSQPKVTSVACFVCALNVFEKTIDKKNL